MNGRRVATVGLVVAVALVGVVGAFAAAGLVPGDGPADEAGPTPGDTGAPNGTTLDHEGDLVTLENDPDQTVAGTTDVAPGSELTVRLQSTNGSSPFIKQATATVADDGSFDAAFDMSGIPAESAFDVMVRHDGENLTVASGEVVEGTVPEPTTAPDDDPATVDYEGEVLTLENDSGQVVSGTTEFDAGSEVVVRLRSSDGAQPFLKSGTTTVGEDGSFEVTFDVSGTEPGAEFTVTVRHDGETVGDADGEVVDGS